MGAPRAAPAQHLPRARPEQSRVQGMHSRLPSSSPKNTKVLPSSPGDRFSCRTPTAPLFSIPLDRPEKTAPGEQMTPKSREQQAPNTSPGEMREKPLSCATRHGVCHSSVTSASLWCLPAACWDPPSRSLDTLQPKERSSPSTAKSFAQPGTEPGSCLPCPQTTPGQGTQVSSTSAGSGSSLSVKPSERGV